MNQGLPQPVGSYMEREPEQVFPRILAHSCQVLCLVTS